MIELISGGTIGLFTGLSLMSLVELAFWIYLTVKAFVLKRGGKQQAEVRPETGVTRVASAQPMFEASP